ncbi:pyridoxal phosphate-dependent decarboxylase family protein [Paracraurococcus lichenis]|uniref:Pyridoxal-dependent decarboxylase n=1 Tax=Paracraurococcus lichenis TaxID=3064888 RepID=A0ABT9E1K1_9PROT|nr:pyridoxal-dependent decarboxylase [Paracraurococcus sp. LOR1-02]MDO9710042.1 pyridoxal-dependent decarboxylase [Paracraurococcus sp. LOR1-02]
MTPDEFRRLGHELIDWIADYRDGIARHPVQAQVAPGEIRSRLPTAPPEQPEDMRSVLADLDRILLPGITHWQSPRFFGYFPANAPLAGVLGDLVSTGLGVIGLSWQSGPAITELEEVVTDWLRQMVGLSPAWSGVIQDTASTSTLVALLCARERATGYAMARGGLQEAGAPLLVYASAHGHSSVEKAALLAGFGRDHLRLVPSDGTYAMRAEALAAMVEEDLARGLRPCAVVATTGTTATTAIDPVGAIAEVARRHGLWLHVDAAMAGSAMILPECRPLWDGIEGADSLVLNPHKWLGVPFDSSLYYVRDPQHLVRVMSTNPSYLQSAADGQVKNLRDWGIPLGRRFRALKLWFVIREQGVEALRARLRRDIANARWLAEQVAAAPHWRLLAPVALQTLCLRHEPPGLAGEALDRHTMGWAERINRSGAAYLTPAVLDGRWMVRVSVGAEATERADVAALWETMRREAEGG